MLSCLSFVFLPVIANHCRYCTKRREKNNAFQVQNSVTPSCKLLGAETREACRLPLLMCCKLISWVILSLLRICRRWKRHEADCLAVVEWVQWKIYDLPKQNLVARLLSFAFHISPVRFRRPVDPTTFWEFCFSLSPISYRAVHKNNEFLTLWSFASTVPLHRFALRQWERSAATIHMILGYRKQSKFLEWLLNATVESSLCNSSTNQNRKINVVQSEGKHSFGPEKNSFVTTIVVLKTWKSTKRQKAEVKRQRTNRRRSMKSVECEGGLQLSLRRATSRPLLCVF